MLPKVCAIILQTLLVFENMDCTDVILQVELLQAGLWCSTIDKICVLTQCLLRAALMKLIARVNTLFLWLCKPLSDS